MTGDPQQTQIAEARDRCNALWDQVSKILQDARAKNDTFFDVSRPVPGLQASISDFDASVRVALDLFDSIVTRGRMPLLPSRYLTEFHNSLQQLAEAIHQITSKWEALEGDGGLQNIDISNLSAQSAGGAANIRIGKLLTNIRTKLDDALESYYRIDLIMRGDSYTRFEGAFAELQAQLSRVRDVHQHLARMREAGDVASADLKKILDDTNESKTMALELTDEIKNINNGAKDLLQQARNDSSQTVQELRSMFDQGQMGLKQISTVEADASKLKVTVDAYQDKFSRFDTELKGREADITKAHEEQEALFKWFTEQKESIVKINDQAESMLAGATTAGLAGQFGAIANKLSNQVWWAQWAFVGSILVLAAAATPLVLFIFQLDPIHPYVLEQADEQVGNAAGLGDGTIQTSGSKPVLQVITEALIRAVLLLPGIWLVKFCAARHAQLFRLKEHYAYKHSVAASVDGFKKQADPYKDETATATFFELTFNPADRMDAKVQEARVPNPLMEKVLKKVGVSWDGRGG